MRKDNAGALRAFLGMSVAEGAIPQEGTNMWKKSLVWAAVAGGLAVAPAMAEARDDRGDYRGHYGDWRRY